MPANPAAASAAAYVVKMDTALKLKAAAATWTALATVDVYCPNAGLFDANRMETARVMKSV